MLKKCIPFFLFHPRRWRHLFNFAFVAYEIFKRRDYSVLEEYPLEGATLLDVGSNCGVFSWWSTLRLRPAKIYLFEPVGELSQFSQELLEAVARPENPGVEWEFHPFGLSNQKQDSTFRYFPWASGLSTLGVDFEDKVAQMPWPKRALVRWACRNTKRLTVSLRQGDDVIRDLKLSRIDLCKIDVEGHEVEVLEGLVESLHLIDAFIIEVETFRQSALDRVKALLHGYDMRFVSATKNCSVFYFKRNTQAFRSG